MDLIRHNIDQITEALAQSAKQFAEVNVATSTDHEKAEGFAAIIGGLQASLEIAQKDLTEMDKKKFRLFRK